MSDKNLFGSSSSFISICLYFSSSLAVPTSFDSIIHNGKSGATWLHYSQKILEDFLQKLFTEEFKQNWDG